MIEKSKSRRINVQRAAMSLMKASQENSPATSFLRESGHIIIKRTYEAQEEGRAQKFDTEVFSACV